MPISINCPHCHKHTEVSAAVFANEYSPGITKRRFEIAWVKQSGERWWIGFCNSCKNPCLVLNEGETIYPYPLPDPTDPNIPQDLARDLDEAKMCFCVNCYRACAVMARRCIQNACLQKGVVAKDLVHQIAELESKGIITKEIKEWATVVRWVGNDAAHPGKDDVKKEDAKDCLELAEQFLDVIFVTPAIAKARRTARGK
jgi:Domain of unknown function (DUF4145)